MKRRTDITWSGSELFDRIYLPEEGIPGDDPVERLGHSPVFRLPTKPCFNSRGTTKPIGGEMVSHPRSRTVVHY